MNIFSGSRGRHLQSGAVRMKLLKSARKAAILHGGAFPFAGARAAFLPPPLRTGRAPEPVCGCIACAIRYMFPSI